MLEDRKSVSARLRELISQTPAEKVQEGAHSASDVQSDTQNRGRGYMIDSNEKWGICGMAAATEMALSSSNIVIICSSTHAKLVFVDWFFAPEQEER